jgi:hypothetical protein
MVSTFRKVPAWWRKAIATYGFNFSILYDIVCDGDNEDDFDSSVCHEAISWKQKMWNKAGLRQYNIRISNRDLHCQIFHRVQEAQVSVRQLWVIKD